MTDEQATVDAGQARATVRRLVGVRAKVPDDLERDILALGAAAVPALVDLLEDAALALEASEGEGWAPVLAARLLAELQAADAVEPMLRVLAVTDWLSFLHDQVLRSLSLLGAPVVEPALHAWAEHDDPQFRRSLGWMFADLGVRDERILAILLEQLRDDPTTAGRFVSYGDPEVLPHLFEALDRYQIVDRESLFANHGLVELRAAIEDLGGTLSAEQHGKCRRGLEPAEVMRRKLEAALDDRPTDAPTEPERAARAAPARRPQRPGRNQPCWCGSAKKYKKCHQAADERGA